MMKRLRTADDEGVVTEVFDRRRRGEPLLGCIGPCMQCFGYCIINSDELRRLLPENMRYENTESD